MIRGHGDAELNGDHTRIEALRSSLTEQFRAIATTITVEAQPVTPILGKRLGQSRDAALSEPKAS